MPDDGLRYYSKSCSTISSCRRNRFHATLSILKIHRNARRLVLKTNQHSPRYRCSDYTAKSTDLYSSCVVSIFFPSLVILGDSWVMGSVVSLFCSSSDAQKSSLSWVSLSEVRNDLLFGRVITGGGLSLVSTDSKVSIFFSKWLQLYCLYSMG